MSKIELIKELRDKTNAGMADCKSALEASSDDIKVAEEWLRKKGIVKATDIQNRTAAEGAVTAYIHMGGKIGVLLEVNCETDFVARTDAFRDFCRDVSLHIAGHSPPPLYVSEEDIPGDVLIRESNFFLSKAEEDLRAKGRPTDMALKISTGQIIKWKKEQSLLDQPFVKDPTKTIKDLMLEITAKTKEKISIRRFTRYTMGEGIEKKVTNFRDEVLNQIPLAEEKADSRMAKRPSELHPHATCTF